MDTGSYIAVVLAAGDSRRFGDPPKQLRDLGGEPLVHRACRTALQSRAAAVLLVVGHRGDEVAAAVADLPVRVVRNPKAAYGQSTSVRLGLVTVQKEHPQAAGILCFVTAGSRVLLARQVFGRD